MAVAAGVLLAGSAPVWGATTTPVGYFTLNCPAGGLSSWCVVLENAAVAAGSVGSVTTTTLTAPGKTWAPGMWAAPDRPHLVQLRTGTAAGRWFRVTGNGAQDLTVDPGAADLPQLVHAGDSFFLRPVHTLDLLFGSSAVPFRTGAAASTADNVLLWDAATQAWLTYFHDGANWRRTGSLLNHGATPLPPDTAMLILRRDATPIDFLVTGDVPSLAPTAALRSAGATFVGNPQPVDVALAAAGFNAVPGWQAAPSAATADNVLIWSGGGWLTFFHNGTHWRCSGTLNNQNAFVIAAGTPVLVYRRSTPPGSDGVLTIPLAYTP